MSSATSRSSKSTSVSGMPRTPIAGSRLPIVSPLGAPLSGSRTTMNPAMPCSFPSRYMRANTRCRRDTPPPVIQCFFPFST